MPSTVLLLGGLVVLAFCVNAFIGLILQREVNIGVPKPERLHWYLRYGDAWKIFKRHKLRYPRSRLRALYFTSIALTLLFFLSLVVVGPLFGR